MNPEQIRERLITMLRELEDMAAQTQDDKLWGALDEAISAVDDAQIVFKLNAGKE